MTLEKIKALEARIQAQCQVRKVLHPEPYEKPGLRSVPEWSREAERAYRKLHKKAQKGSTRG